MVIKNPFPVVSVTGKGEAKAQTQAFQRTQYIMELKKMQTVLNAEHGGIGRFFLTEYLIRWYNEENQKGGIQG